MNMDENLYLFGAPDPEKMKEIADELKDYNFDLNKRIEVQAEESHENVYSGDPKLIHTILMHEREPDPYRDIKLAFDHMRQIEHERVAIIGAGVSMQKITDYLTQRAHIENYGFDHSLPGADKSVVLIMIGDHVQEMRLQDLKDVAAATTMSVHEVYDALEKAVAPRKAEPYVISNLMEGLDKFEPIYDHSMLNKVEHFVNKNVTRKIGGKKHKKNPFRFRK